MKTRFNLEGLHVFLFPLLPIHITSYGWRYNAESQKLEHASLTENDLSNPTKSWTWQLPLHIRSWLPQLTLVLQRHMSLVTNSISTYFM